MRDYLEIINKTLRLSFYAVFFATPLILYPKTLELFEFNKLLFLYAVSLFILFLWISKMILLGKFVFKRTVFDIPILLFLISQIISTFLSMDPYVSFWGYYTRFNGGLLSLITYIFLYYALTSNFSKQENSENSARSDLPAGRQELRTANNQNVRNTESPEFSENFGYKLLIISLFSGLAVALWGFSSHFGHDLTCLFFRGTFDVSCWTDAFQPTVRLFSTLGQPNWLAAYFSILIPISLSFGIFKLLSFVKTSENFSKSSLPTYLRQKPFLSAICYLLLALFLFIEVLWSQSQSGYLGLLSGLFVFFAFLITFFMRKKSIKKIGLRLVIPVMVLFFITSFFLSNPLANKIPFLSINGFIKPAPPTSVEKATAAAIPALEGGGSDSGKIRLVVWSGAFELFKKHPIFGSGVETFAYGYYLVKPVEHNLLSEWDYLYNKAHNEYLNYLATTGAVGLLTYAVMIIWFLFIITKYIVTQIKKKTSDEYRLFLSIAFLSSYISILVSNFFGFSVVVINLYFFVIPAFFFIITKAHKPTEDTQPISFAPPKKTIGILALGIICAYFELYLLNIWFADQAYSMGYNLDRASEYVAANQYLENAVKLSPQEDLYKNELALNLATLGLLLSQQNQATQAAQVVDRSVALSDEVVNRHPQNVVFYKTRIQTFFVLSQLADSYYDKALDSIMKARILAPTDAKIAYNHGLLLGQKGDTPESISMLKEAIALKPNYRDPRYAMAVYLIDMAKAEKNQVKKISLQNEAKDQLDYILKNLSPQDKQATELLNSIK